MTFISRGIETKMKELTDPEYFAAAYFLALKAHEGQTDKAGKDYIEHPIRVADKFDCYTFKTAAILHDVLEDTWVTEDLLRKLFPKVIVDSVVLLTRKEGESYGEFIDRMCHNEEFDDSFYIARAVKIEDFNDNLNLSRLDKITDEDIDRVKKYMKFKKRLEKFQHDVDAFFGRLNIKKPVL